ncbi:MAG: Macrolide export protein MacA, partial [Planctomycetota bacterium]
MILKFALPALAAVGAAGAFYASLRPAPAQEPGPAMAASPYPARIAGSGLVESAGEEIAVAAAVGGILERHSASAGARVALLESIAVLDGRVQRAALASAEADLAAARARLSDLRAQPRADDLPPAEARVARARADLALADD